MRLNSLPIFIKFLPVIFELFLCQVVVVLHMTLNGIDTSACRGTSWNEAMELDSAVQQTVAIQLVLIGESFATGRTNVISNVKMDAKTKKEALEVIKSHIIYVLTV